MDPLKIDIGAEIIDLVKRLGAPQPTRRRARPGAHPIEHPPLERPHVAPHEDTPEPPEAA